jgi:predicted AlkP superfamily pyrophosphatase or phosphodiesterase
VRKVFVFSFLLVIFFLTLIISSLKLSRDRLDGKLTPPPPKLVYSNGTHPYHKTTILISLDGLRADFLDRKLTPTLEAFANSGVTTDYMTPAFPSVTFPNHWTLVTGLYPESHGIVSNMFWDPVSKREFFYTDSEKSLKQDWWGGEPIWMTAELQGLRAAVHMWPGSEAPGWGATVVDKFNMTESLNRKVDRILGWLDLPASLRPQLIASYVPDIDVSGHKYGPNTTETDNAIKAVDSMLHDLFLGLESRNLTEIVNLVIVSDHGMATTSKDKLVYLEDIVDTKLIEHIDGLPLYGLRPYDDQNLTAIYNSIKEKEPGDGSWKVYLRDVDMPKRWHFSNNPRIAPLWLVPETGWTIITKEDRSPDSKDEYSPRGLHGFDNEHPLMRAIFVARGPAFRHLHGEGREYLGLDRHTGAPTNDSSKTKGEVRGSRVKPFENIELYRLLCQSLGINETVHGTNATLDELEIVVDGSGGSSSYFSATPLPTNTTASPDEDVPSHPTKITDASVSNTDITSAPPAESVPPRPTKIAATNAAIQTPTDTSTAPPDYVAPKRPTKAAASPESSPTSSKAQDIAVRPPAPPPDQQKPESDGSEEKDPGKMSWWELLESKAEKMKGELEGWWSKVWKDKKNG